LSVAAEQGRYAIVERLLDKGADINHQMRDGLTPLMSAVKNRRLAIVQLLLKRRPDLSLLDYTGRGAIGWAQAVRDRRAESMLRRAGAVD
jgi:ankyrin repeat protein